MKIAEIQNPIKPLSPEQSRVNSIKQSIDNQKIALAQERERQQNAKYQKKIGKLKNNITT
jgi:hypothetical protein